MKHKHVLEYKWTVEQLKQVIAMLRQSEFDSKDIDPHLHKRMEKAVLDGSIKCFNMQRVSLARRAVFNAVPLEVAAPAPSAGRAGPAPAMDAPAAAAAAEDDD
jgi:hypothetical protein